MKDYDKNIEPSYLKYWNINNLHGWAMPQKLLVNKFEQIENTSQFKRIIMERVMKDILLKLMFNTLKNYIDFIMTYHF